MHFKIQIYNISSVTNSHGVANCGTYLEIWQHNVNQFVKCIWICQRWGHNLIELVIPKWLWKCGVEVVRIWWVLKRKICSNKWSMIDGNKMRIYVLYSIYLGSQVVMWSMQWMCLFILPSLLALHFTAASWITAKLYWIWG